MAGRLVHHLSATVFPELIETGISGKDSSHSVLDTVPVEMFEIYKQR